MEEYKKKISKKGGIYKKKLFYTKTIILFSFLLIGKKKFLINYFLNPTGENYKNNPIFNNLIQYGKKIPL